MEAQYFLKKCLKTRDVGCHLGLEHDNVANDKCRNENCDYDDLYDLTDFHSYLRFLFFASRWIEFVNVLYFFITNCT